jgi:hypothetical protein
MTNRRSSITGATTGADTVETETVCDFSSTVRVVFEGNGFPAAFLTGMLFTADFLAGAAFFAAAFLAGAFLATFFAEAFLAGAFLAGAFFATFLAGAFFAAAFLATALLIGFLGMSRTLCPRGHLYQLRHGHFFISL